MRGGFSLLVLVQVPVPGFSPPPLKASLGPFWPLLFRVSFGYFSLLGSIPVYFGYGSLFEAIPSVVFLCVPLASPSTGFFLLVWVSVFVRLGKGLSLLFLFRFRVAYSLAIADFTYAMYSGNGTAFTHIGINAWFAPHISLHCP